MDLDANSTILLICKSTYLQFILSWISPMRTPHYIPGRNFRHLNGPCRIGWSSTLWQKIHHNRAVACMMIACRLILNIETFQTIFAVASCARLSQSFNWMALPRFSIHALPSSPKHAVYGAGKTKAGITSIHHGSSKSLIGPWTCRYVCIADFSLMLHKDASHFSITRSGWVHW